MADPITLTGTAVGVASLGLTVLRGLIKYCKAVKGQTEELRTMQVNAEREEKNLELIWTHLSKFTETEERTHIEQCLAQAHAAFRDLDDSFHKYNQRLKTSTWNGKGHRAMQRAIYPFRREIIKDLKEQTDAIGKILGLAMQIVHMYASTHTPGLYGAIFIPLAT